MQMDLRSTFENILREWGVNVLLQRRNLNCKGYQRKLELHTVRHTYPQKSRLARIKENQREGVVHTVDILYYFKHDVKPREGDRIYEYDGRYPKLDADGEPIDNTGISMWLIDYALKMHGKGGQTVFYTAGVTRSRPV